MKERFASFTIAAAIVSLLAGCTETQYTAYGNAEEDSTGMLTRNVEFEVTGDYYREFPDCAVVMPFLVGGERHERSLVIENAIARQLTGRLSRTIGPKEREKMARSWGIDTLNHDDMRVFSRQAQCRYLVEATPWGGDSIYVVFWTQSRIGLEMRMVRAFDDELLWRARHVATRSDGGLPLSPISAVVSLVTAAHLKTDGDVDDSLAHDAVRRMVLTLPDSRI